MCTLKKILHIFTDISDSIQCTNDILNQEDIPSFHFTAKHLSFLPIFVNPALSIHNVYLKTIFFIFSLIRCIHIVLNLEVIHPVPSQGFFSIAHQFFYSNSLVQLVCSHITFSNWPLNGVFFGTNTLNLIINI